MSPLLAPILAQLVTLQLGDRTEARYIKYDLEQFEGTTSPGAILSISSRRSSLQLGYGPSLTLQPLEKEPRELLVFHQATAAAEYNWPRTALSLTSTLGWGELNFRFAALQGPGALDAADPGATDGGVDQPDGEPTPSPGVAAPQAGDPGAEAGAGEQEIFDEIVRYYTSTTTLSLTHDLQKDLKLGAQLSHTRAGGLDDESKAFYQPLSGWSAGGSVDYTYAASAHDSFVSNASLIETWSSNDNTALTLNAQENWEHRFNSRTASTLGAGINITRFAQASGLRGFSIFPTFQLAILHTIPLWRGTVSLMAYSYSAPALDPLRALVDPRVGAGGSVGYVRKRFSFNVSGNAAFSLAPQDNDAGAIDAAQAEARVGYAIAELVGVDAGARYVRQAYQGVTVLPSSYAVFVGLDIGYQFRVYGSPH